MIAWITFLLNVIVSSLFLFVPGLLLFLFLGFKFRKAVAVSPAASLLFYVLIGIIFSFLKIKLSALGLLVSGVLFSSVCVLGLFFKSKTDLYCARKNDGCLTVGNDSVQSVSSLIFYPAVGLFFVFVLFVNPISGPYSFSTTADAGPHLNYIRAFIESGSFSALHVGENPLSIASAGFYPASFHVFSAMLTALPGCTVTMAANITIVLICAAIFPLGSYSLLIKIFGSNSSEVKVGAIACLCNVGFPWAFLIWGQLDSNLLGFALVPAFVVVFWDLLFSDCDLCLWRRIFSFFICAISLIVAQPNAIFTAGIFCIPLIIQYVHAFLCTYCKKNSIYPNHLYGLVAFVLILIVALIWVSIYQMPFMRPVVTFDWPNDASLGQALLAAILMKYGGMLPYQFVLAPFVLLGLFIAFKSKEFRPLGWIYLYTSALFIASYTKDFPFQSLFSGFWYNDFYRMGAMAALSSIPLTCLSFVKIFDVISNFRKLRSWGLFNFRIVSCFVVCGFLFALLHPSIQMADGSWFDTPFGSISSGVERTYLKNNPEGLDYAEWDFVEDCQKIVKNDVVINLPFDGSGMLYGATGMNTVYRNISAKHGQFSETKPLREHLCDIADNTKVQKMVSNLHAKYVLILDCNSPEGSIVPYAYHPRKAWRGILDINENTPGFELVLSREDMRLFKIK